MLKPYNPQTFKPDGIYTGMPMADYAKAPGLSASMLKLLLESPLTYWRKKQGLIPDKQSASMQTGQLLHGLILEGKLDAHVRPDTYGDGKPWHHAAKECKAWSEAHADKPIVSADEHNWLVDCSNYIYNHPTIAENNLIDGATGDAEVSVFATINGRQFKGRFDYLQPGYILDLKCVNNASDRAFLYSVTQYGWHLQAALYLKLAAAFNLDYEFVWLALQTTDQPLLNVKRCGPTARLLGDTALEKALTILDRCEEAGIWPDFPDDDGSIKALNVPEYMLTTHDAPEELTIGGQTITV
jgi:exodeoxyribonuclease VIII